MDEMDEEESPPEERHSPFAVWHWPWWIWVIILLLFAAIWTVLLTMLVIG